MRFKLKSCLMAFGLTVGFSVAGFANEAPVVDIQQEVATESGQSANAAPATDADGASWQPVSANNADASAAPAGSSSDQPGAQQWASSQQNAAVSSASSGDMAARVSRLEQQMSNYSQMNLPQQISDMQQKLSVLQGQLEVDQREIQQLTTDQKNYYQDLQQQIGKMKQNSVSSAAAQSDLSVKQSAVADNKQAVVKASVVHKPGDTKAYQQAFHLLSKKHFNQANDAFKTYLQNYPQGVFAVNAYFWLGEIALMNQHYNSALTSFHTVVDQYPASNKVSDAKLKIAMIHAAQGETDEAKNEFKQIAKDYPGSTAAQLASIRLQQLSN